MKIRFRIISALLVAFLLLTAAVSCADTTQDPQDKDPTPSVTDPVEQPTETPIPREDLDLPDKKFDHAEFHVAEWTCGGESDPGTAWVPWEEIATEDRDGDLIGQAVYSRNNSVEELLGVRITKEYLSVDQGYYNRILENNTTGEDAYQMITQRSIEISMYISSGLMTDLQELDQLSLDTPWWVEDSVVSLALGDHLYFAASEILMRDKGATAATFFNKVVADNHGINDIYTLVENGNWTLEAMCERGERVAASLDGDDLINSSDDMWGCINNAGGNGLIYLIINGYGQKFGEINDYGEFEFTFDTDDAMNALQRILKEFMFADFTFSAEAGIGSPNKLFKTGHCLFFSDLVRLSTTELRTMDEDYGIIPCPKLDEKQENYSSLVFHHHSSVLGIPEAVADKEMAASVVEALSWESYYTVYPKFYDTILVNRNTRDEESKVSLQIVFDTRSFDPGLYYNGTTTNVMDKIYFLVSSHSDAVAGAIEACSSQIEHLEEIVNGWIEY